jgi:predicted Zn finger-like uncharacterized protein
MIIDCINCNKKFKVNSDLIPDEGRSIQCGSCNHLWFFVKNKELKKSLSEHKIKKTTTIPIQEGIFKDILKKNDEDVAESSKKYNNQKMQLSKNNPSKIKVKSNFTFGMFLSYILVFIISFVGLVILLDTFKSPLYNLFPNLELLLFSFFETLKDIDLFIKDLF